MKRLARRYGAPVSVGLLLGLLGPFGTYDALPVPARLGYWLAVVSANWIVCDLVIRHMDDRLPAGLPLREAAVPLAGGLIASLPATGIVHLAGAAFGLPGALGLFGLWWKVALLCMAISLPFYTWAARTEADAASSGEPPGEEPEPSPAAAPPSSRPPRSPSGPALFFARLARPPAGRLLCLEMQDHYLAVHTDAGGSGTSELVLCRMEDAARELDGLGRRVHRSWWVAADAVAAVERDGARVALRLTDGRMVPVGRTYRADLRAAGWLGPIPSRGTVTNT